MDEQDNPTYTKKIFYLILFLAVVLAGFLLRTMSSVVIPDGSELTKIGKNAFYFCTKLSSINIPRNAMISKDAFAGCACIVKKKY